MANYSLSLEQRKHFGNHHLLALSNQCHQSIILCYQAIAMLAIRQSLSQNLR